MSEPLQISPPGRWPYRLALALGCLCLLLMGWSWMRVQVVSEERQKVEAALAGIDLSLESGADQAQKALRHHAEQIRRKHAIWRRRRLGFFLSAVVLLLGGFWAGGIRRLYERGDWAVIEASDNSSSE